MGHEGPSHASKETTNEDPENINCKINRSYYCFVTVLSKRQQAGVEIRNWIFSDAAAYDSLCLLVKTSFRSGRIGKRIISNTIHDCIDHLYAELCERYLKEP